MIYHNKSRPGRPKRPAKAHGEAPHDTTATMPTEDPDSQTEPVRGMPPEAQSAELTTQSDRSESVHSVKRLTRAEEVRILRYVKVDGLTQKLAAEAVGCSESTVSRYLASLEDTGALAVSLLKAASADAATRWAEIARTSKRHDAAKDLLLHTGVIQPLEGESGGAKVQILIGQPGSPITIQTPQVIDTIKVSEE